VLVTAALFWKVESLKSDTKKLAVNGDIRARQVRLVDQDGKQLGIVPIEEALKLAETATLDLVEIAPEADPVVCKIMDFGKYIYEAKKQKAASKKKQKIIQVKEVKFRPGTEEGDYQVKLRNLVRFLENGDKAKVTLRFRGREMVHQEIGMELIKRIEADLEPHAVVEQSSKMEGRQLTMVLGPKKKK
jgi:translation initiation factor IF-3